MNSTKERRQVEIISLLIDSSSKLSVADLCESFGVEVATIHRDLRELREHGILIHSVNRIVGLLDQPTEKQLRSLLALYISSVDTAIQHPKNVSFTVKKLKEKSLPTFVALVHAIEERRALELTYYKMFDDETVVRTVEPYDLIPAATNWRLVARSDGKFKQFIVENIESLRALDQQFSRSKDYNSEKLFRGGFDYWSGEEQIEVVIKFSKRVASVILHTIWSEDQKTKKMSDGSVLLHMTVNSLENTGNWLMAWGGEVKVLEPKKLRRYIMNRARGILNNNRHQVLIFYHSMICSRRPI